MKTSSMIKGAALLAAAGTAAYLYSASAPRTKRRIKRTAGGALHTMGDAFESISKVMH